MPIPRNWTEELTSEWLQLIGYLTEVGVPVGVGTGGGRKEADVVGVEVSVKSQGKRLMHIKHFETGQLTGNHNKNVDRLMDKFSASCTQEIENRFKKRLGPYDLLQYEKVYVDIWGNDTKAQKLMDNLLIKKEGIIVWTPKTLFNEVTSSIINWLPEHKSKTGEGTIPEGFWMLKLLASMSEYKLF